MIHVDESDPVGELEPSFPYRDVTIRRGVEAKEFYDLEEEIGRGKFGTVYRCRERSTGLTLAAKFVSVPRRDDRRNVEREVDIMRQLQHPRLIQLYDAFDNGKAMCVVLELIEGGELFERVIDDDFILTEKSCTVFMRQICEGIEFIHKQNILHLDMKPENILCLTKTGNRIKIIDFGLARRFDPQKKLQVLFGTPEFVAPEVVNFDQIGYGTDMWSVGVICYVLLSGLSPFMGETDIETMANVTVAKFDFDDEAFNDISEEARDFITKLLIKNKEARMTATQCVNHPFLRRKPPPVKKEPIGLETTKDNLRSFVERWGEHPNSPYLFDITAHIISPLQNINTELTTSSHSLRGFSPSPCGSLHTSPDSVIEQDIPAADLQACEYFQNRERRASDSSCIMKKSDVSERVNLAEEIKKLSDKLFKLAMMPTELKEYSNTDSSSSMSSENTTPTLEYNDVSNLFKHNVHKQESSSKTHSYEKIIENNYTLTRSYKGFSVNKNQKNIELDYENNVSDFDRPKKFKITGFNRDVPLIPTSNTSYFSDEAAKRIRSFSIDSNQSLSSDSSSSSIDNSIQHATNTKDMLLHLLGKWDDSQDTTLPNVGRHKSISVEWTENEAQRSMNSLNTFFQSRQSVKKTHSFLK